MVYAFRILHAINMPSITLVPVGDSVWQTVIVSLAFPSCLMAIVSNAILTVLLVLQMVLVNVSLVPMELQEQVVPIMLLTITFKTGGQLLLQ